MMVTIVIGSIPMGKLNSLARYLSFRQGTTFCQPVDNMPIAIPGNKIHVAVNIVNILQQHMFNMAHGFDKYFPVHRAQKSQAANRIADRNLIGGLLLGF